MTMPEKEIVFAFPDESQADALRRACIQVEELVDTLELVIGASKASASARKEIQDAVVSCKAKLYGRTMWRIVEALDVMSHLVDTNAIRCFGFDAEAEADEGQYEPDGDDLGWEDDEEEWDEDGDDGLYGDDGDGTGGLLAVMSDDFADEEDDGWYDRIGQGATTVIVSDDDGDELPF